MTTNSYPFQFVGTDTSGSDKYMKDVLVYTFVSQKSGHRYQVNIERYLEHLCCVKFLDRNTNLAAGRFSQLSGTYEPRTILRTVAEIALDALKKDPEASFCFVGAADGKDDRERTTRRFRVYMQFVKDLGVGEQFWPFALKDYSMCVLVNKNSVSDREDYISKIISFIE